MTAHEAATERAKQYERLARIYAKKAQEGDAGAAPLAQAFASLTVAARTERIDWRMRVLGGQLEDLQKSMDGLRRKLPER
jgi:N-acetylglucosamine kinase-like BadF-type ATPase